MNIYPMYFAPNFDPSLKAWIVLQNEQSPSSLSCQDESERWADMIYNHDETLNIEKHDGFFSIWNEELDDYDMEGHTWLVIDGNIFDPTIDQFDNWENDVYEYETTDIYEYGEW